MSEPADRWTVATVYPDMWVDHDDDPRNNDGPSPDGELATYLDYLESYRLTLVMKCDGLDPARLAERSLPPSPMSLLGLVRHLAEVDRDWRGCRRPHPRRPGPRGPDQGRGAPFISRDA